MKQYSKFSSLTTVVDEAMKEWQLKRDQFLKSVHSRFDTKLLMYRQTISPRKEDIPSEILIELAEFRSLHESFEIPVDIAVKRILKRFTPDEINVLSESLLSSNDGFDLLTREKEFFESALNRLRSQETSKMTIDEALIQLEVSLEQKTVLKRQYTEFSDEYQRLIKDRLSFRSPTVDAYIEKKILPKINDERIVGLPEGAIASQRIVWDLGVKQKALKLLPLIFALKTLKSADSSWNPHPVQVLSILLLCGSEESYQSERKGFLFSSVDQHKVLKNLLLQIGTGEGKSVTLAMSGIIFALLGYDVNIAIYSTSLVKRDSNEFLSLFNMLGLMDRITYDTFYSLAEKVVNEKGNLRDKVLQAIRTNTITTGTTPSSSSALERPKILLIDEVDIFYRRKFYSDSFDINAKLTGDVVRVMMEYLWNRSKDVPNFSTSFTFDSIIKSTEYQMLIQTYPDWKYRVDVDLLEMIDSLKRVVNGNFKTYEFSKNNRICYKLEDSCSEQYTEGYETDFLYFKEYYDHQRFDMKTWDEIKKTCIGLNLEAGNFLYSLILLKGYVGIFGVTGTLNALIEEQLQKLFTLLSINDPVIIIPSVYGSREGRFSFAPNKADDMIIIEKDEEYFMKLQNEITHRMNGGKRAVIVFFDSKQKIERFFEYLKTKLHLDYCVQPLLTANTTDSERNQAILNAVRPGFITLAEGDFDRGTDFASRSKELEFAGGVHVILTYFPLEKTEQIQWEGRTARSLNHGSASMVLLASELMRDFQLPFERIQQIMTTNRYDELDNLRTELLKAEVATLVTPKEKVEMHEMSMKLRGGSVKDLHSYFQKIIADKRETFPKRVLFTFDYSTSMQGTYIHDAVNSLLLVLNQFIFPSDYVGVILFSNTVWTEVDMTLKSDEVINKVKTLTSPSGGTAFYQSVWEAMDQLQDPNKPQPFAIKNDWIVAITDGDDNASINYQMTLEKLIERFGKTVDTGLIVMGIGVGSETKKKLETLAASAVKFGQYIGPDGSTDGIKAAFAKVGEIIQGRGRFNG